MKRLLRIVLYLLGTLFFVSALVRTLAVVRAASELDGPFAARAVSYLFGLLLPSIVCFLIAALLRERKTISPLPKAQQSRNVVGLTPRAAEFAVGAIASRNYPSDTVLRVVVSSDPNVPYDVKYDLPSDSDRDWVGESLGVTVVVEKALAEGLEGVTIDFRDGRYVFEKQESVGKQNRDSG